MKTQNNLKAGLKMVLTVWATLGCCASPIVAAGTGAAVKIMLNGSAQTDGQIDGQWRFLGRPPQEPPEPPELQDPGWLPISVPGDVNDALQELKRIPDPHFDTQATNAYWITGKEWWYARQFDADVDLGRRNELVLDGVDGVADLWLNGKWLGTMKDYFYPHRFSVAGVLKPKGNRLLVRFQSLDRLLGGERKDVLKGWLDRRAFLRKPQFNFGWDWALPLPGIGLGGQVWLESGNELRLEEFALQTFKTGRVDFNFQVSQQAMQKGYKINVRVGGHGVDLTNTVVKDAHKSYCTINIPHPQLWFPNGYGEPNLYDYSIELVVHGQVVDTRQGKFGIRESRIQENPFTPGAGAGRSFNMVINDEPVFCKGANWIPMEIWPATIDPSRYEFYLRKFKEAHFNMIRVWGGGIYEQDRFYQLCDELGIMVWQDFMFAGAGYPWDTLKDDILQEANYQIKRLRTHPSVVLWCGINEDVYAWVYPAAAGKPVSSQADIVPVENSGDKKDWKVDRYQIDPLLFHAVLRGLVGELGLGVPYVPSSPSSQDDFGNYPASGNHHQSCWKYALFESPDHPENYRRYFNSICSFDSEFAIQGPCNVKAFHQFMAAENLWPPNAAWILHVQRGHKDLPHYEQTLLIAGGIFGKINSLEDYVKFGQATHLEQTRDEYESARRDRPNNGGTMSWMYNDCWPTANWSIIDYYRQPKPAYYAAKRACAPVLPIIFERNGQIEFFVDNDTLTNSRVRIRYGQESLAGRALWEKKAQFVAGKNSARKFATVPRDQLKLGAGDYLFIQAEMDGVKQDQVIWFPDGWKNIPWPEPAIRVELAAQKPCGDRWLSTLKVSTDKFARLVHLTWKNAPANLSATQEPEVWFSDNYFDLPAGGARVVTVESKARLDLTQVQTGDWLSQWQ